LAKGLVVKVTKSFHSIVAYS